MKFIGLLQHLEERLGYHQFPVNPTAADIKSIFEGSPLHIDLVTRLVRAIYKHNDCRRLSDPVTRETTFAALAPIRLEVLRSISTDVDVYRLMDDLCLAIEHIFNLEDKTPIVARASRRGENTSAQVIEFDAYRRNRWLKSWA